MNDEAYCLHCGKSFDQRDHSYAAQWLCVPCENITVYVKMMEQEISKFWNLKIKLDWKYAKKHNAKHYKSHGLEKDENIIGEQSDRGTGGGSLPEASEAVETFA